ncbi:hypothetical protein MXD81_33605 [Microbacteriaceae bacterium K1510]|nr:hypothetical protein [Microbacteriaceae bacterium K1510]
MQNSLDLIDDDDLYVVREAERVFGISIGREAETTYTVGQFYDLIQAKCRADQTLVCFSQVAFYRLRHALGSFGIKAVITPDTPMSILRDTNGSSIARNWRELGHRSGLKLPRLETPFIRRSWFVFGRRVPLGALAFICAMAGAFVLARHLGLGPTASFWTAAIGVIVFTFAALHALYVVCRDIPQRIATIGDLAREAAGCSFSELRQTKPMPSDADRWYALTAILRQVSGHKLPITRDTTFVPR